MVAKYFVKRGAGTHQDVLTGLATERRHLEGISNPGGIFTGISRFRLGTGETLPVTVIDLTPGFTGDW
jgi:hypothetical protein